MAQSATQQLDRLMTTHPINHVCFHSPIKALSITHAQTKTRKSPGAQLRLTQMESFSKKSMEWEIADQNVLETLIVRNYGEILKRHKLEK